MASAYLEQQIAKAAGTNAEVWQQLENLYTRKLWHQVTVKLLDIINDDMFANGGLLELYESFLTDFSSRINPVSFVNISLVIATQIASTSHCLDSFEFMPARTLYDPQLLLMRSNSWPTSRLKSSKAKKPLS
eukprot:TRINITY_DN9589_c0_g1_i6.p3 TRINITY_DN9589_c0_g1~~TRINITY_DN9589_c0_g1_i6.p3  ORF type:complete len:132 (+),score=22.39 TRINITY_DN9589_c0_g1_i6:175-570(+)